MTKNGCISNIDDIEDVMPLCMLNMWRKMHTERVLKYTGRSTLIPFIASVGIPKSVFQQKARKTFMYGPKMKEYNGYIDYVYKNVRSGFPSCHSLIEKGLCPFKSATNVMDMVREYGTGKNHFDQIQSCVTSGGSLQCRKGCATLLDWRQKRGSLPNEHDLKIITKPLDFTQYVSCTDVI